MPQRRPTTESKAIAAESTVLPGADGSGSSGSAGTARTGAGRRRVREPSEKAMERELEIYEAAAELFHRKGYAATTLQDIAEAVGLLKGSLYYYIDTKEDLLYRITRSIHEDAMVNLQEAQALDGGPDERLHAFARGHVSAFGRRLTWIRVFYTEHGALTGERRREIMSERRQYERFVEDVVAEGQRQGIFCPALDTRIVMNGILTMINSVYLWYRPGQDSLDEVARVYADLAVRGLRCEPHHDHAPARPKRTKAARAASG
jgi:TetR/AcrR family transcriptional regulator, cholesterol catabolism regulator